MTNQTPSHKTVDIDLILDKLSVGHRSGTSTHEGTAVFFVDGREAVKSALYSLLEAEAVDAEMWVGVNQSIGHAEAFDAVPLSKIREMMGVEDATSD